MVIKNSTHSNVAAKAPLQLQNILCVIYQATLAHPRALEVRRKLECKCHKLFLLTYAARNLRCLMVEPSAREIVAPLRLISVQTPVITPFIDVEEATEGNGTVVPSFVD